MSQYLRFFQNSRGFRPFARHFKVKTLVFIGFYRFLLIFIDFRRNSQTYLETLLVIKIFTGLVIESEELSLKIVEISLGTIAKTLVLCHPSQRKLIFWHEMKGEELFLDLQNHCFRLLRYLFTVKKNKNLFKLIFPSKIFASFLDIGSFVKNF